MSGDISRPEAAGPSAPLQPARRVLALLSRAALVLAGAGLVTMTAAVAWQVWGRYVLGASPIWTEPLSLQLMSWFIFLGAAVGVREGYHLGFEALLTGVAPGAARALRGTSALLVAGFGVAMMVYGGRLAAGTWGAKIPVLGLPGGFDYLPVAVGGALVTVFALEQLVMSTVGAET